MEESDSEKLVSIYLAYHRNVNLLIEKVTGEKPKPYKELEQGKLERMFQCLPQSCDNIIDFCSRIMSNLLRMHALPNTNHRTTIYFIQGILKANEINFPEYDYNENRNRWWDDCNRYICESKYFLKLTRKRKELRELFESGIYEYRISDTCLHSITQADLTIGSGAIKEKHRGMTKEWLDEMVSTQSDKCANESSNCMSRFIAHWGISE